MRRLVVVLASVALVVGPLPPGLGGLLGLAGPISAGASVGSYPSTVLADTPSVYYRLGESSGSTAADSSGHGVNGTYTGAATLGAPGAIASDTDTAITVSGVAMTAPAASLPLGNAARTLEVWVRFSGGGGITPQFVTYGDFGIGNDSTNNCPRVLHVNEDTACGPWSTSDGTWHLYDVTYDGVATASLYLDGAYLHSWTGPSLNTQSSSTLQVGIAPGDYDELAVYPAALTSARIAAHWTRGSTAVQDCAARPTSVYGQTILADRPSVYYRVDDLATPAKGRVAFDVSGHCANGSYGPTVVSQPADALVGDTNPAVTSTAIGMTASTAALPLGGTARTLEVWVKPSPTGLGGYPEFFSYGDFGMGWDSGVSCPRVLHVNQDTQCGPWNDVLDGHWHLFDVSYDGAGLTTLYLDGAGVKSWNGPNLNTSSMSTLQLGSAGSDYDELAIYPTALPPARIAVHWVASGNAPPPAPMTAGERRGSGSPSEWCAKCFLKKLTDSGHWPVDNGTGNFYHSFTDFSIPGRGTGLSLTRTYNASAAATTGPFGFGWSSSFGSSAAQDPMTGAVTITEENGAQIVFNSNGGGGFTPATGRIAASLVNASGGGWTLTRRGHEQLTFNSLGQLTTITDRNTNTTSLAYVGSQLSTVTDPGGRTLTFVWTGPNVTSVHDSASPTRTVTYTYDGNGDLVDVQDVGAGHTDFAYTSHLLVTMRLPRFSGTLPAPVSDCVAVTGPQNVVSNHYDTNGRIDCQYDQVGRRTTYGYVTDGQGNVTGTTITDPAGHQTVDTFSGGFLTSRVVGAGSPVAGTWSFLYDPTTVGIIETIDPNGHTVSASYDADGNTTTAIDGLGRVTQSTFNAFDEPLTVTDPKGVTTTATYDGSGNLTSAATPLLDAKGNPVMQGGNPVIRTVTYNHLGGGDTHPEDVTSIVDPDAHTWTYTYDGPTGYRTSVVEPATTDNVEHPGVAQANTTRYLYDLATGWLTATLSARGVSAGGTLPCTPPLLGCTTFAHDAFGHVTTTTDPLGHQTVAHYDADQNLDTTTDPNTNLTSYTYDAADERTIVTRADAVHTTLKTDYNLDGTVKDTVDGANNMTSYAYDAQHRPITSTTPPTPTSPSGNTTTLLYDLAGNRVGKVDPGGSCTTPVSGCTTYSYDEANQLTAITYSDGVTPNVSNLTYDADGQRAAMTDGTGTSHWGWDSLHRMTSSMNGAGQTVGYGYDLRGDLTTITYPGTTGTVTRAYDEAGRLRTVTDWQGHATSVTFDADSDQRAETYPNTVVATSTPDNADQLTGITDTTGATTLASFTYGRDSANQLNSVTSTGVPADTHSYSYTPLNQLKNVDGASTSYGYDTADNPSQLADGTLQNFDAANELTTTTHVALVGTGHNIGAATASTIPVTFTAPAAAGDTILVASVQRANGAVTTPGGYSILATFQSGTTATDTKIILFRKTAVGGEASVTITYGTTFAKAATAAIYRGVDTTNPIDVQQANSTKTSTTVTVLSVTPTVRGDQLLMLMGATNNTNNVAWTVPAGMTDLAQAHQALAASALADQPLTTTSPTGNKMATYSSTGATLEGALVALRPARTTYTFDTRGNRTSVAKPSGTTALTYDQANRLVAYGATATYTYNGDGLRTKKTVSGVPEPFVWDEAEGIPQLLVDGTTNYVYGPNGAVLEQLTTQPTITRVAHGSNGNNTSNMLPVTFSAPTVSNDQIILESTQTVNDTVNTPTGYTIVGTYTSASGGTGKPGVKTVVYRKTAVGGETSVTITYTGTPAFVKSAVAEVYRGVDPATPIDPATLNQSGSAINASNVTVPSVTTGLPGEQLVAFLGAANNTLPKTWTSVSGMTIEDQFSSQAMNASAVADQAIATPGATGSRVAHFSGTAELVGAVIALRPKPSVLYYHQDQLGNARVLTDSSATPYATSTFDTYGKLIATTGPNINPFGYAGQYTDAEIGFIYLRARYYDPATAQWISRDPQVDSIREAYQYVGGNPLNNVDPDGMNWLSDKFSGAARAVGRAANAALPVVHDVANVVAQAASVCAVFTSETLIGGATCGTIALGAAAVTAGTGSILYAEGRESRTSAILDNAGAGLAVLGSLAEVGAAAAREASAARQALSEARWAEALNGPLWRAPGNAMASGLYGGLADLFGSLGTGFADVSRLLSAGSFGLSLSGYCR